MFLDNIRSFVYCILAIFILLIPAVIAYAPSQGLPILNSTFGRNTTLDNLTVYNISTADADNDTVKNIIVWNLNNVSFANLYMPFDGGSNSSFTLDYANGYGGLVDNNVVWNSTAGYDGFGAYEFDGSRNAIRIPYFDHTGDNGEELTLLAWIKAPSTSGRGIASHFDWFAGERSWAIILNSDNISRIRVILSDDGSIDANHTKRYDSSVDVGDNLWHHVGFTWDKGELKLFIDGEEDINITKKIDDNITSVFTNFTKNIVIGGLLSNNNSNSGFNGTIDEVIIFNSTLTTEQIRLIYNNRTDMIDSSMLTAGDVWKASITPNDRTSDGIVNTTNSLTIVANNAPKISALQFNVTNMTESSGIMVNTTYIDIDGDYGTVYFSWFINGTEIYNESITNVTDLVNSSLNIVLNDGDLINVTVYANDGIDNSTVKESLTLTFYEENSDDSTDEEPEDEEEETSSSSSSKKGSRGNGVGFVTSKTTASSESSTESSQKESSDTSTNEESSESEQSRETSSREASTSESSKETNSANQITSMNVIDLGQTDSFLSKYKDFLGSLIIFLLITIAICDVIFKDKIKEYYYRIRRK